MANRTGLKSLLVAGFSAFVLLASHSAALAIDPPFPMVDAQHLGFSYAYAPSIIRDGSGYHVFFCSQADPALAPGAWDFIRETTSPDGKTWSTPIIKVIAKQNIDPATGLHRNYAACDPSLVYFDGYYYMYYSDSIQTSPENWIINQTQITVARSQTVDGDYLTYTDRGTWEKDPLDPKYIVRPKVFRGTPIPGYNAGYGAGQQSVVSLGGKLYMWYGDDSDDPVIRATQNVVKTYLITSTDPVQWDDNTRVQINRDDAYSVDIKYDPLGQQFVMPRLGDMHQATSFFAFTTSKDGITWSADTVVIPKESFPDFANNSGIESDREGHLTAGTKLFAFAAPYGLAGTDTFGSWNMYGYLVSTVPPLQNHATLPGDLNTDSHVDLFDYNLLISKFGNPYTIFDYNNLVANFGKTLDTINCTPRPACLDTIPRCLPPIPAGGWCTN